VSQHPESKTPSHVWREMTPGQRVLAAQALLADEDSGTQQADAVQAIARQLRFRPQSVLRLAPEKLARHLASLRTVSETLASRALVVYHLVSQRPMLEAFLDHVGVTHDHGLIADSLKEAPDPARLRAAAAALLERFPAADVRVYLDTLAAQDPDVWGALAPIAAEIAPS
jgi:hypothetical protein